VSRNANLKAGFTAWHGRWGYILGWVGLVLILSSFLNKEILEKVFEKRRTAIQEGLKAIDVDEALRLQISSSRSYGTDKSDLFDSFKTRLEVVMKLAATDEYYQRRIAALAENDLVAKSDFLATKGVDLTVLRQAAGALAPLAFAPMANISQYQRAEREKQTSLFGKTLSQYHDEVFNSAEQVFLMEHNLYQLLNEWADQQRKSLRQNQASLKRFESLAGKISVVLFVIGFLLSIVEKAAGKGEQPALVT